MKTFSFKLRAFELVKQIILIFYSYTSLTLLILVKENDENCDQFYIADKLIKY